MGTLVPIMGSHLIPAESPIGSALFGATRRAVLRILFGRCDERFYFRQIVRAAQLGTGAVQRELLHLWNAGIVSRTTCGVQTYYRANSECPIFGELRGLVLKTFGVAEVLRAALRPLESGIDVAFIYGSVASGTETAASDVDVMVVGGRVSLDDVVAAFAHAQRDLGREVNPSVFRTAEFCRKLAAGQHFLTSVVAAARVFLIGDERELARLAGIRVAEGAQDKPGGDRRPVRSRRPRS
jgi:predicted nucleotidyltransferase